MECASWFIHKYILHGWLWKIHETHHRNSKSFFELNDLVSLFFATSSIVLIIYGLRDKDFKLWMGAGIAFYGILYFILHDIFIHKRIKFFKRIDNKYIQAISRAHRTHHKHLSKNPSESFGLLWVNKKFFDPDKE